MPSLDYHSVRPAEISRNLETTAPPVEELVARALVLLVALRVYFKVSLGRST